MSSRTETAHAQSLNEQDSLPDADKKPKSRKPASEFPQLRLSFPSPSLSDLQFRAELLSELTAIRHCLSTTTSESVAVSILGILLFPMSHLLKFMNRPILTPKSVLPLFFAIGIVFAPIGGVLLWASSQVLFPCVYMTVGLVH